MIAREWKRLLGPERRQGRAEHGKATFLREVFPVQRGHRESTHST